MHFPSQEQKQQLLDQLLKIADQRLGAGAAEARAFIALYYDQLDPEDLAARDPEDLYGAAMAHLGFARRFSAGTPKLRVYNPRTDEHGWRSPHTVIELVNDDMPFLVDSVMMEVNRLGYTLHLLNHPLFSTRRDNEGQLEKFAASGGDGRQESLIHVEVDREIDPAKLKALGEGIQHVLGDDFRASTVTSPLPDIHARAIFMVGGQDFVPGLKVERSDDDVGRPRRIDHENQVGGVAGQIIGNRLTRLINQGVVAASEEFYRLALHQKLPAL